MSKRVTWAVIVLEGRAEHPVPVSRSAAFFKPLVPLFCLCFAHTLAPKVLLYYFNGLPTTLLGRSTKYHNLVTARFATYFLCTLIILFCHSLSTTQMVCAFISAKHHLWPIVTPKTLLPGFLHVSMLPWPCSTMKLQADVSLNVLLI